MFSLNRHCILVRNTLHIPGVAVPLYSLRAHQHQHGCGFFGTFEDGFHVLLPSFVLSVDMSSDCHLTYESLSMSAPLQTLHYVQPRCAANLYPSETLASSSATTTHLVIIEDKEALLVADVSHSNESPVLASPPSTLPSPTSPPTLDVTRISGRLDPLSCLVARLLPPEPVKALASPPPEPVQDSASPHVVPNQDPVATTPEVSAKDSASP
jgi:hypothetical protein